MNFINQKDITLKYPRPKDQNFINLAQKIYDPSKHAGFDIDKKIENNLHFIWLTRKIPELHILNIKNFAELNPDLNVILWVDDHNHSLNIPGVNVTHFTTLEGFHAKPYFDQAVHGAKKADILRYFVILKYGGLYLDIDCQPIKSLDGKINKSFVMYNSFFKYLHSNAYFAFYKDCAILKFVNDVLPLCYEYYSSILEQCGPTFFCRCIYFLNPNIYSLSILDAHNVYWEHKLDGSWLK